MAKIIINVFGSLGDIHPYLAIANTLKIRGHRVTFATNEFYRDKIESEGHDLAPIRPDLSNLKDGGLETLVSSALDPGDGIRFIVETLLLPYLRETYEDLMAAVAEGDLLISSLTGITAPMVAAKTGKPWISTVLSPLYLLPRDGPISLIAGDRLIELPAIPFFNDIIFGLLGFASVPWAWELNKFRLSIGLLPALDPLVTGMFSPNLVLGLYSPLFAPLPRSRPGGIFLTGFPAHDTHADYRSLPEELDIFLSSGEAPVVFTLGSSAVHDAGDFFISGAAAARALGLRAVLLVGEKGKDTLNHFLDENTIAYPYIPYSLLFPRVLAVVHHGGIGTTAAALSAGIPSLIVPFGQDQPDNARRARDLGVARVLLKTEYKSESLTRELAIILEEQSYRRRASFLGRHFRSENGEKNAADLVEKFLFSTRTTPTNFF